LWEFEDFIVVYEAIVVGSGGGEEPGSGEVELGGGYCEVGNALVGLRRGQIIVGGEEKAGDHASCR
jgi:hypothetical protein